MWLTLFGLWFAFSSFAVWSIATSKPDPYECDSYLHEPPEGTGRHLAKFRRSLTIGGIDWLLGRVPARFENTEVGFETPGGLLSEPKDFKESREHEPAPSGRLNPGELLHRTNRPHGRKASGPKQRQDVHASEAAPRAASAGGADLGGL